MLARITHEHCSGRRIREPLLEAAAGTCGALKWVRWSSGFGGETFYFDSKDTLLAVENLGGLLRRVRREESNARLRQSSKLRAPNNAHDQGATGQDARPNATVTNRRASAALTSQLRRQSQHAIPRALEPLIPRIRDRGWA
jgi:hypothetical protein